LYINYSTVIYEQSIIDLGQVVRKVVSNILVQRQPKRI